jgi:hypothetical protein
VAENVADPSEGKHQAGIGQHIADDDPLDHLDREVEASGDGGKGDVHRRV